MQRPLPHLPERIFDEDRLLVLSSTLEKRTTADLFATPQKRATEAYVVVAIFCLALLWFSLGTLITTVTSANTVSVSEKRMLAAFPHLNGNAKSIAEFPAKFEVYLNDHLIDRDALISGLCWLRFNAFNVSTSTRALVGKDGWLYLYFNGDKETLEKVPQFTDVELKALVKVIEQRNDWATSHGIKYLFVMTPSKSSIYPEFIDHAERQRGLVSRREQLFKALKAANTVDCLDLAPVLVSHKSEGQLYLKTDTHWNDQGAFIGYQAIIERLRSAFPCIQPVSKITPSGSVSYCGDLAKYLGLDGLLFENVPRYASARSAQFSKNPPPPNLADPLQDHKPFATEKLNAKLPRLFCLRDSFMIAPQPYLSESFSRAYFSWSQEFSSQQILREHPDVILDEMTERLLYWPLPPNRLDESQLKRGAN